MGYQVLILKEVVLLLFKRGNHILNNTNDKRRCHSTSILPLPAKVLPLIVALFHHYRMQELVTACLRGEGGSILSPRRHPLSSFIVSLRDYVKHVSCNAFRTDGPFTRTTMVNIPHLTAMAL